MTKNCPISITTIFSDRLLLFDFFLEYWNASNTGIYIEHNSFSKRLESSSNLEADWRYNCWSLDELDQILSKLNEGLEELNPNLFFGKEIGYIDHVKWTLLHFRTPPLPPPSPTSFLLMILVQNFMLMENHIET